MRNIPSGVLCGFIHKYCLQKPRCFPLKGSRSLKKEVLPSKRKIGKIAYETLVSLTNECLFFATGFITFALALKQSLRILCTLDANTASTGKSIKL
jgi:hypothetical protein